MDERLENNDARGILKVIGEYSKAFLLIAESNPKEKDIIVDLVMNFLQ